MKQILNSKILPTTKTKIDISVGASSYTTHFNQAVSAYHQTQMNAAILNCDKAILNAPTKKMEFLAKALKLSILCKKDIFIGTANAIEERQINQLAEELKILPKYFLFRGPFSDSIEIVSLEKFAEKYLAALKKSIKIQKEVAGALN